MKSIIVIFVISLSSLIAEVKTTSYNRTFFDPFIIQDDKRIGIEIDALYWQALESGLDFAVQNKGSTTEIKKGKVKSPSSSWDVGEKIALDLRLPRDKWDIKTRYTSIEGDARESVEAPEGGAVFPTWMFPTDLGSTVDQAKAHWHSHFYGGEVELGRRCQVGNWLSLRPSIGVKGIVILQRYHLKYEGGTAVPAGDSDRVKMFNNYWGVGPRFALNTLWGFGKSGISLFADGAISIVTGQFHVNEREFLNVEALTRLNVKDDPNASVPIAELGLGLQYDRMVHKGRCHVGFKLGWEMNYFFNQNRLMRFSSAASPGILFRNNGDLSYGGVTFGINLDF